MLRLKHCAEWLYYGIWYWLAWYTLDLPKWLIHGDAWLRQPFLYVVQQGWVFSYLPTLDERREMAAHNVELTGAARLYRAASSDRRERG